MRRRRTLLALSAFSVLCSACSSRSTQPAPEATTLPNGWRISPVGRAVETRDLVLKLQPLGGNALVAVHSGFTTNGILRIDTAAEKVEQALPLRSTWYGMDFDPATRRLFVSGGNEWTDKGARSPIYLFDWNGAALSAPQRIEPAAESLTDFASWSGIAFDRHRNRLYVADRGTGTLPSRVAVVDAVSGKRLHDLPSGIAPYDVVLSPSGWRLFVSNWASHSVSIIDLPGAQLVKTVEVGANPSAMLLAPDGRLFVTCSAADTIVVLDSNSGNVLETISTRLYPRSPSGSTPNALALDTRRALLYVANADNNCVLVIDVSKRGASRVLGSMPTGWYPSALALTADGNKLVIACSKGAASRPTLRGPYSPLAKKTIEGDESIKTVIGGTIYFVDLDNIQGDLEGYSRLVYRNSPYRDSLLEEARGSQEGSIVPSKVGAGSPIKHVVYIIKENRTYDQVFGDTSGGNGDRSLAIFGGNVTPNHHALAYQYGLFDNFYVDGEVSADGHQWSNAAYATDYTEKQWPARYALFSRQLPGLEYSPAKIPPGGYLWDLVAHKGLTYRSYGEFADRWHQTRNEVPTANVPALNGHLADGYDLNTMRDTDNARYFLRDLTNYNSHYADKDPAQRLPSYTVLILGEDHTFGATPGKPTPRACVASNDYALGQIIDGLSHSPYWPELAVFVTEDDAQDGPDHVDAHRSVLLVISPYSRPGAHHNHYTTSSILRTIELLLGLPPMTQYDAAAMPLYAALAREPHAAPYVVRSPQIDLNEFNRVDAWGSRESLAMDFSNFDRAPTGLLNEIIWRSIRGALSPMPRPVNSRNIRLKDNDDDDDDR